MAVSRRDFNSSLLMAAAATLAGCGFRPRGSEVTIVDVGRVFVDADRGVSIAPYLRDALTRRDFDLAGNRDRADVLLRVTDEQIEERIVSVQSSGRVSEFELSHTVALVVQRADGGQVSEEDAERQANLVRVTREYTFDETEILGKQNEARILREELREELVMQIVLRALASLADSVA